MTSLSVNLNKIALLRNSRGRDYPNVVEYAKKFIDLGVQGITIHPRQDERHAKRSDAIDLGNLLSAHDEVEFNIEGYPSADFLDLISQVVPDQCTLVPDDVNQLTSDHGWNVGRSRETLVSSLDRLSGAGVRSSLFLDPDLEQIEVAANIGCDRIELYTEEFAETFHGDKGLEVFENYKNASRHAQSLGLGVNAGHDLDLTNLGRFLEIENILEVSIGHALTIECIDLGIEDVVNRYLKICSG
jgi:pyridoxine 5-phosphate synthase